MKAIQPLCSHPDILNTPLPDLSGLEPDSPLQRFSAIARQQRIEAEADSQSAEWWLSMATAARDEGSLTHAMDCALRAIVLGLSAGHDLCVMQARLAHASIELLKGSYGDARAAINQMAGTCSSSPDGILEALYREAEAGYLVRTGHYSTGEFVTAMAAARRALEIYRAAGDLEGELRCLSTLGSIHAGQGDYPTALQQLDLGVSRCSTTGNWQYCHVLLCKIALSLSDQGYREGVAALFLLSRQWSDFVGDRVTHAATLAGEGRLYYFDMSDGASGEFDWRSAPLVAGAGMALEMGALPTAIECHTTLASMCEKARDLEGAHRHKRMVVELGNTSQARGLANVRIQERMELEAITQRLNRRMADRLHQGIEASPDAFLIFDVTWKSDGSAGDYVNEFRNPAANVLLGLKPDSLRVLAELCANPLFEAIEDAMHAAVADGIESQQELRINLEGGGVQWLIRRVAPSASGAMVTFRDVSEQRELLYSAMHDSLTGLPNRASFERKLNEACQQARDHGREHVLCFVDLDRFKIVNDSAGHAAGDALLREVGALMRESVRRSDFTARLGGDEFALLLEDCTLPMAEAIAGGLVEAVSSLRFPWRHRIFDIGASIGLTVINRHARPAEVMGQADVACYAAKSGGRNRISVYDSIESATRHVHREIQIASAIRSAIHSNRFRLYAQEIRGLDAGARNGRCYELLLRMVGEEGDLLEPGAFLPAAERYDLMTSLDRWVVHTVLVRYAGQMRHTEGLAVSINISASSLNDPLFLSYLLDLIRDSGLSAGQLSFEITETTLINNLTVVEEFVAGMHSIGCGVTLDDFGTGLCSFQYLRQFALDGVKIDGSFIRGLKASGFDRAVVESIHAVGRQIGIRTTAECVEDPETLAICLDIGIDFAQGYAVSKPAPFEQVFVEALTL